MAEKKLTIRVDANTAGLSRGMKQASAQVNTFGSSIQKGITRHAAGIRMTGMALAGLGAAVTGMAVVSIKAAVDFEKQLANVSTMLDESAMKLMPKYADGLRDMATEFGQSTETLSKGLYDILSASIPPAKALDVLAVSAKAAVAGLTETGITADAITTILNSYGFAAEDAGEVSDKLWAIIKKGKTTMGELAPSIGKVAAVAATAGLSFDELGATLATITRGGVKTDVAMTNVKAIMLAFLKPTDDAAKAAKEFGLELSSNTLRSEGLRGVIKLLSNATAEQLATILPNVRGLTGMAIALKDTTGWAESYEKMLNSAGLTEEMFQKQTAATAFTFAQLKQEFIGIARTIGTEFLPIVKTELVPLIREAIEHMKVWLERFKGLSTGTKKLLLVLGPLLIALGGFLMILPSLAGAIGLLLGPVGLIIVAIAGLTAAFMHFYKTSAGFRNFVERDILTPLKKIGSGLQFMIENWNETWKAAYQIIIETFKQMKKTIWKFFTDWSAFKAGLNLFYQFYKTLIMTWTRTLEMLGTILARVTSVIWAPLIKSLQWVADNIVYYFSLGMQLARNAVFKGINIIGSTFAKGLNTVFGPIFKKLGIDMEEALTFEIPEITLKQPAKFAARMGEAWAIIKDQYSKIPGDLRKYVDNLVMEWENVTKAAGEFGEAVDWSDYAKKLGEIIKKLKAAGVNTAALEKEQEKLNKGINDASRSMAEFGQLYDRITKGLEKRQRELTEAQKKALEEIAKLRVGSFEDWKKKNEERIKKWEEELVEAKAAAKVAADAIKKVRAESFADWKAKNEARIKAWEDELAKRKATQKAAADEIKNIRAESFADWKEKNEARIKAWEGELAKRKQAQKDAANEIAKIRAESFEDWKAKNEARIKLWEDELAKRKKAQKDATDAITKIRTEGFEDWKKKNEARIKLWEDELAKRKQAQKDATNEIKKVRAESFADWKAKNEARIKLWEEELTKRKAAQKAAADEIKKIRAESFEDWKAKNEARIKAWEEELAKRKTVQKAAADAIAKVRAESFADWKEKNEARIKMWEEELAKRKKQQKDAADAIAKVRAESFADWKAKNEARIKLWEEELEKRKKLQKDAMDEIAKIRKEGFEDWKKKNEARTKELFDELDKQKSAWKEYHEFLATRNITTFEQFVEYWNSLTEEGKKQLAIQKADWEEHTTALNNIWAGFTSSVKSSMSDMFYDMMMGTTDFKDAWQAFCNSIKQAFVRSVADMLVEKLGLDKIFSGNILEWGNLFTGVFSGIGKIVGKVFKGIGKVLVGAGKTVAKVFKGIGKAVVGVGKTMTTTFNVAAAGLVAAFVIAVPKVLKSFREMRDKGARMTIELGTVIETAFGKIPKAARKNTEKALDSFHHLLYETGFITTKMGKAFEKLYVEASGSWSKLMEATNDGLGFMVGATEGATENMASSFDGFSGSVIEDLRRMKADGQSSIGDIRNFVALSAGEMANSFSSFTRSAKEGIYSIPTRIDFDVVGNLQMPDIPFIGDIFFDIIGQYQAPAIPSFQHGGLIEPGELVLSRPITSWLRKALSTPGPMSHTPSTGGSSNPVGGGVTVNVPRGAVVVYGDIRTKMDEEEFEERINRKLADEVARRLIEP